MSVRIGDMGPFNLSCRSTTCPRGWVSRATATCSRTGLVISVGRFGGDLETARGSSLDDLTSALMVVRR